MKSILKTIRQVLPGIIIAILIVAALSGYVYVSKTTGRVFIDDSLINAQISNIGPSTPGTLQELDVYEGETIQKGQLIGISSGQPVYAPDTSLVTMANTQIGSNVSTQAPIAQIISVGSMRVAGTIDENKGLNDVKVGQVASFTVDAFPGQTFWGYIDEISPSAKTTQVAFSISSERPTQQFVIYVTYDNTKYPQIRNGMSAKTTIYTNTK